MQAIYLIVYGPFVVAAIFAILAMINWRRNLGATPLFWALVTGAILCVCVGVFIPIALTLGGV